MTYRRFHKVWCHTCKTMQFKGECPHPQDKWTWTGKGMTGKDVAGLVRPHMRVFFVEKP